ncbi:MAG: CTP synthase [Planctomycetota bacterium]|jgi:CTP synthase|nr:CTP synthase [Planctomycetota bacterium]
MSKRKSNQPTKHLFVSGGVVSSLGKGITAASIGRLLVNMGYSVRIQKLDPYLNVDPGTMNPFQHGEVFVTDDGSETDLDLGHYERFLDQPCTGDSTFTSGQIYQTVIQKERAGEYNGGTVQVVPHITNEIKEAIRVLATDDVDVVITEIGGTVGDIEGLPFMEAVRQFRHEVGRANVALCHVAYIPYIKAAGEIKTKPAQHSVQKLREIGLVPDFLMCRTEHPLNREIREKLALFCNVDFDDVIELRDVPHAIYEVPQIMLKQDLHTRLIERLGLAPRECDMRAWDLMLRHIRNPKDTIRVGLIGKYINHQDAYKSVTEAIDHAAWGHLLKAEIVRLESESLEGDVDWKAQIKDLDAIVVPGGFGQRGFEGKLRAIQYCREQGVPYLGLCLGMQTAAVEFARNVLKLEGATSVEMEAKPTHPIIVLMESQKDVVDLGGTMRLGTYPCTLVRKTSKTSKAYGNVELVHERHRHRFEFNLAYKPLFEEAGMMFTGLFIPDPAHPERHLVEIMELKDHPFFVATQAHPEFQSSPVKPHPLFKALIGAAYKIRSTTSNTSKG